ncbi:MAG: lytic transglycosylase domain-containing protein [Alphaproteobacteria bacterium]|nr:lytic transglycosylase domain-containing protein [Alphaproteobacteria bacterium]
MQKKLILNILIIFSFVATLTVFAIGANAGEEGKFSRIPAKSSRSKSSKIESVVHELNKRKKNPTHGLCYNATTKKEAKSAILPNLLTAISVVESGRAAPNGGTASRRARSAWAWTVTANGKGHYYPSKQEAIAAVKDLQSFGVESIDVGCMQVNLKYHADAFGNLGQAFDPKRNVEYASKFLTKLHKETGSWITAAQYYHSRNKTKGSAYVQRLSKAFFDVNASANQELEERIANEDIGDIKKLKVARLEANKKHKVTRQKSLSKDVAIRKAKNDKKIEEEFKKQQKIANSWRAQKIAEHARLKWQKSGV